MTGWFLPLLLAGSMQQNPMQEHQHHEMPPPAPATRASRAELDAVRRVRMEREMSGDVRTLVVGSDGFATVRDAVARSAPGDTVRIRPGIYRESVMVHHPLVILGEAGAVLDAGGEGTVLHLMNAPGSVVRGLTLRASGDDLSREEAGLMAERSPELVVESCRFEDVLFGIYLKESRGSVIRNNTISGKDLDISRRGDGVRLWSSADGLIEDNRIHRTRDVVIWFSDSATVRRNEMTDGRYGLHYMYSDHGRFEHNRFTGNMVGAFLMYSSDLQFADNAFVASRGATGMGLGLKDADDIRATNNVVVGNALGIFLDNSPQTRGSVNRFRGNTIAMNRVGVSLLPSVQHNEFVENTFLENLRDVEVTGGGTALANRWAGNRWSAYAGFDQDGDGVGDTPFVVSRLSDRLLTGYPALSLFTVSPAAAALDVMARVLPFLQPKPVLVDERPVLVGPRESGGAGGEPVSSGGKAAAALLGAISLLALGVVRSARSLSSRTAFRGDGP